MYNLLGAGPLVVVIDDAVHARDLTAQALARAGFSVLGVGRADAGAALAHASAPALILLNVSAGSAWLMLQTLKQDTRTRDIPVVVLSNNGDRAQALSLGAAEHLSDPVDRDVLAATAMRLARLQPAARAAAAPASTQIKNVG
jgi:CheY-like chemotaxis protein